VSCRSVMLAEPVAVRADASVAQAIDLLFQHRIRTLPVVDTQGVYQGLFGISFLLKNLLPKAATLNQEIGLSDLAFMHDTLDDVRHTLKERLASLYPQPVTSAVHRETAPLSPEDGLLEAMLRIHRAGFSLPVVDKQTHKLVGIVSHWSILAKLTGRTL
jgi:CBS-domain-containing membrane protein